MCICDGYERGYLTAEDIGTIYSWREWVERVSATDTLDNEAPARIVAGYSHERELRVRQNFLAWLHENVSTNWTLDDVTVFRYYGTFDGREVVFMDVYGAIFDEAILEHEVAGYNFIFSNMGWGHYRRTDEHGVTISTYGVHIWLHNDGEFMCICDGYERGYLTAEDIGTIYSWREWHDWFNSMPEEEQAAISVSPPSMVDIIR